MVTIVKHYLKPYSELIEFNHDPYRSLGEVKETVSKVMRCQHCGAHKRLPADGEIADVGDLCRSCWKFICPECVKKGTCDPFEAVMERMESGDDINLYRLPSNFIPRGR